MGTVRAFWKSTCRGPGFRDRERVVRKTVLIVEDNFDSRVVLATLFKRAGYRVVEAVDGQQAIEVLNQSTPDLIVLDIALPKADGWTVASFVRDTAATRAVPIVAVTATDTADDLARAARLGFAEYFCKPVLPFDVLRTVETLIGPERRGADRRSGNDRRFTSSPPDREAGYERRTGADRRRSETAMM